MVFIIYVVNAVDCPIILVVFIWSKLLIYLIYLYFAHLQCLYCCISYICIMYYICVGSELIGRHRSSWLPEGEAPPPYRGALSVHRQSSQPLRVQQSFPDLPTFAYRLDVLAAQIIILSIENYFLLRSSSLLITNYYRVNFDFKFFHLLQHC